ncbi:MAG TPA: sulfate ABC transporter substrate-binding protein [Solirubrobacteraceae bacterium]|nr:sulfate ABC transporter substrate-binding protein [Solirubrobacteraceae bacterium]
MTRRLLALLSTVALVAGLAACGSSSSSGSKHLSLVAYSTPQAAYAKLTAAFEATPAGRGVTFTQSFGASGQQSKAVLAGLPANVVALSLDPDVTKLVKAGLVSPSWDSGPNQGIVSTTVAVIIVRRGNPKHITGWDSLIKPGVQVVTPNPVSSGSARWNILAAYGAELKEGKTPAQADAYLTALFKHVVSQDTSARNAEETFLSGRGNALLDYENEAISLQRKGEPVQEVLPSSTILIQNPAAVVTRGGDTAVAQQFISYLQTPAAQQIFASEGFRPTIQSLVNSAEFPTIPGLFTAADLGGWTKLDTEFFDPGGLITKIDSSG